MSRLRDTSHDAERVQIEIWRGMSAERKLVLMRDMTLAIQKLAFAELRQRYPDAPDDELWIRLAARRLPPDLMWRVYGRNVEPS